MKAKYLIAASTLALIACGHAQAADIVHATVETPIAAAPAYSWQGFYAGGQIGGSWGEAKSGGKIKPDGFIGGLFAGYNFDAGNNIILGAETDFLWGDVSKSYSDFRVKEKWVGATRLRAGYALDRWMPYIAAGVAYGDVQLKDKDINVSKSKTMTGWTAGVGVDYAVTDNVLLRAEYRYTDLGKKNFALGGDTYRVKYTANDFRVGVAYKF